MIQIEAFYQPSPQWREHLKNFEGSIFLTQQWLEAFQETVGQPIYFVFREQNNLRALIAGLEKPLGNGKRRQLFFFSGIASADKDPGLLKECRIRLLHYAREKKYWRVIMKSYDYLVDCRSRDIKEYVPFRREEFIFDLTLDCQAITHNLGHSTRQKIRKAREAGLVFKEGRSEGLLMKLFQLMDCTCQIRAAKGYGKYSVYCMPFLTQKIALHFLKNKQADLHYIEKEGQILSMSFLIILAQKAYCIWMGTHPAGYNIAAPYFLTHETLWRLRQQGIKCLNMGGVPLGRKNQGIKRFKLNMGARAIECAEQSTNFLIPPLCYLNHILNFKRFVQSMHLPWTIKKNLLQALGLILRNQDRY